MIHNGIVFCSWTTYMCVCGIYNNPSDSPASLWISFLSRAESPPCQAAFPTASTHKKKSLQKRHWRNPEKHLLCYFSCSVRWERRSQLRFISFFLPLPPSSLRLCFLRRFFLYFRVTKERIWIRISPSQSQWGKERTGGIPTLKTLRWMQRGGRDRKGICMNVNSTTMTISFSDGGIYCRKVLGISL